MLTLSEKLHIGSTFLIFGVSLLGFYLPVYLVQRSKKKKRVISITSSSFFLMAKTFSAGVILGVAMLHLIPDGIEDLEGVADYPLALALMCVGIIATLCMEQAFSHYSGISHSHHHKHESLAVEDITLDHSHNHSLVADLCDENCHMQSCSDHAAECTEHDHDHEHGHDHQQPMLSHEEHDHGHDHGHDFEHDHGHQCETGSSNRARSISRERMEATKRQTRDRLVQEKLRSHSHGSVVEALTPAEKALVKSVVLEVSVAIHSIIVGFGMGLLTSTMTIRVLMLALSFHQFFEGFSLGTVISETILTSEQQAVFSLVFAFTMPIGIMIGMLTSTSAMGATVQGCANSVAAGSLIYSCLVEMVAEIFSEDSLRQRPVLKMCMILSFTSGCGLLGALAVWA